jgi:hypothetical protein
MIKSLVLREKNAFACRLWSFALLNTSSHVHYMQYRLSRLFRGSSGGTEFRKYKSFLRALLQAALAPFLVVASAACRKRWRVGKAPQQKQEGPAQWTLSRLVLA